MCSAFEEMSAISAKMKELWVGSSADRWCSKNNSKRHGEEDSSRKSWNHQTQKV